MKIDADAIRELAGLLDETGLTEIEVAEGENVIRVNKGNIIAAPAASPVSMPSDPTIPQAANTESPDTMGQNHPGAVTSPMVGTVYMAPEPGAPNFISKGSSIQEGETLMIIEAMKVMNPIKAPKSGTIIQIAVENGQPVEYGDVLVIIE
tara:strand:+ start:67 stop:516 length:450 start_codon:yes stop_codon:yes gene_type:complete